LLACSTASTSQPSVRSITIQLHFVRSYLPHYRLFQQTLFNAPKNSPEYDRAEILEILIEDYEGKHYLIEDPDPIKTIKYSIEENGMNQTELGRINR
jgi:antitoxin component HigA of HigAB toxin-antitoxin module